MEVSCAGCNTVFEKEQKWVNQATKRGYRHFCSSKCHNESQLKDGVPGKRHYRRRAFAVHGKICKKCGYYLEEKMLDVDHIDNDRNNNSVENLQVLCVWCHALKTRLGR